MAVKQYNYTYGPGEAQTHLYLSDILVCRLTQFHIFYADSSVLRYSGITYLVLKKEKILKEVQTTWCYFVKILSIK